MIMAPIYKGLYLFESIIPYDPVKGTQAWKHIKGYSSVVAERLEKLSFRLWVILSVPAADNVQKGCGGVQSVAILGLMQFLFAPVAMRKWSLAATLVRYSMYGTLEMRCS